MAARHLPLLASLVLVCGAVQVLEPAQFAGDYFAIRFNRFIGPQNTVIINNVSTIGFSSTNVALTLTDQECADVNGTMVLWTSGETIFHLGDEYRAHMLIQECGGIGVLRILEPPFGPQVFAGIHVADRDTDCCRGRTEVTIPVVSVWHEDFNPILAFVQAGGQVRVSLGELDEDEFETRYRQSVSWNVLLRGVLPVLNIAILVLVVFASYHHRALSKFHAKDGKNKQMNTDLGKSNWEKFISRFSLVQSVFVCETLQTLMRLPYFIIGPGLINSTLTWAQFSYLGSIGTPLQVISIVLSLFMYHRIGAVRWQDRRSTLVNSIAIFFVGIMWVFEIAQNYLRAQRYSAAVAIRLYLTFLTVVMIFASLVFWFFGVRFLITLRKSHRRVASTATKLTSRERARRRLTLWIMFGGTMRVGQVVATMIPAALPDIMYTPHGIASGFFFTYLFASLTSFGVVMAFFPQRVSMRRNSQQQVRNSTKFNGKGNNARCSGRTQADTVTGSPPQRKSGSGSGKESPSSSNGANAVAMMV